jgi:hypothetical protein
MRAKGVSVINHPALLAGGKASQFRTAKEASTEICATACEGLAIIVIRRMIFLAGWPGEFFGKMPFGSLKLKPESGANQIKSADDAYSFVAHMRLSYQNKPHWQVARQALNHAGASDANEIQAWRAFRVAVKAEGWLAE